MRILYDGAIYQWQTNGGINRYYAYLIGGLPNDFIPHLTTCQRLGGNQPVHPSLRLHTFPRFRPRRVSLKFERRYFGRITDSYDFDLAHPTYYSLLSQREFHDYRCPAVVTVWDMIHERFPEHDPGGRDFTIASKRRAVESAEAIICISESTKQDLLEFYGGVESKVSVTHLASGLNEGMANGSQPIPSRPYFLYVGARAAYKNFGLLLSAFASAAEAERDVSLCVVGPPLNDAEVRRIRELGLTERTEHYAQPSDQHLARLYARSVALVYPSSYEGFGIPPLEAMSCGTAVIASNISSIPEVVGDAGLLVDPRQMDEWVEAMLFVLRNPTERAALISRGRARANLFSWQKTVSQTVEVYQSVAR
jgi:glycosyltransferase involved in cell wall biosynthesis